MIKAILLVALGAVPGAVCRFLLQAVLNPEGGFPAGTFASNIFGCFLAGLVLSLGAEWSQLTKSLIVAGVLGSLTTLSSFISELFVMLGLDQTGLAVFYFLITLLLSSLACGAGWYLGQKVMA